MFFAIAAQAQEELLTTDQIDEIYVKEKTPGVLEKLTEDQQKEIVIALRNAQEENARKSVVIAEREASRFKDALERSFYEDDVYQNLMLTSRRAIAEKYGIKAGDTSMVEMMYVSRTGIYDPR
jgi:hypothetical protein